MGRVKLLFGPNGSLTLSMCVGSGIPISDKHLTSTRSDRVAAVSILGSFDFNTLFKTSIFAFTSNVQ